METIDYQDILEATARAADLDPDDLSPEEFSALRTARVKFHKAKCGMFSSEIHQVER